MNTYRFTIKTMNCGSCVKTVTDAIKTLPGVQSVIVHLQSAYTEVKSEQLITLEQVSEVLRNTKFHVSKYSVFSTVCNAKRWSVFKPLIIAFTLVVLYSFSHIFFLKSFSFHIFMHDYMGAFFLLFGGLKFLNLKGFADSFAHYDPLAKRIVFYGYVYPFVEIALAFMFLADTFVMFASFITVVVVSVSTVGIYKSLKQGQMVECACLGSAFSVPLSWFTFSENVVMVVMALWMLFFM